MLTNKINCTEGFFRMELSWSAGELNGLAPADGKPVSKPGRKLLTSIVNAARHVESQQEREEKFGVLFKAVLEATEENITESVSELVAYADSVGYGTMFCIAGLEQFAKIHMTRNEIAEGIKDGSLKMFGDNGEFVVDISEVFEEGK